MKHQTFKQPSVLENPSTSSQPLGKVKLKTKSTNLHKDIVGTLNLKKHCIFHRQTKTIDLPTRYPHQK